MLCKHIPGVVLLLVVLHTLCNADQLGIPPEDNPRCRAARRYILDEHISGRLAYLGILTPTQNSLQGPLDKGQDIRSQKHKMFGHNQDQRMEDSQVRIPEDIGYLLCYLQQEKDSNRTAT